MNYQLPDIRDVDVKGKRVFLRSDLDAPIQFKVQSSKFKVEDDTRLAASLPTLKYLLEQGAKVVLAGHLRRPEEYDPKLSLLPVAEWLDRELRVENGELKVEKTKIGEFDGWRLSDQLFLLENLRFHKEEKDPSTSSGQEFIRKLASLADIYVNDAFASSHRKHASIVGLTEILPHYAGIRLQKEISVLSKLLKEPDRPLVVIIGGAKIETKLPLVEKMHQLADYVLVGGKIANENREILRVQHEKIIDRKSVILVAELNEDKLDITPKSAENFLQIINLAKTIIWNGPVGKTEEDVNSVDDSNLLPNSAGPVSVHLDGAHPTSVGLRAIKASGQSHPQISESLLSPSNTTEGSRKLAEGILNTKAYSVVGGGDTLEFLKKMGILEKFSFFSTGGGAMLAFLSGEKLPGIEALKQ